MAEVIRIAESASEAATPALPQNVEAEAALLGALMIDNRLVEDVQLKLKPLHFFEPLHGRIYEAILKLTDSNRIANPVTLKPLFDADEGMKEVGGPSYLAQLTGSGAAVIGARDFASQIYDLALLRALDHVAPDPDQSTKQGQVVNLRGEIARADHRRAGPGQLGEIGRPADLLHRLVRFEDRLQRDRIGDHILVGHAQDRFVDAAMQRLEEMVRLQAQLDVLDQPVVDHQRAKQRRLRFDILGKVLLRCSGLAAFIDSDDFGHGRS